MRTLLAQACPPPATGIAESALAQSTTVADAGLGDQLARIQSQAPVFDSLNDLVEVGLDGVIIATPSA